MRAWLLGGVRVSVGARTIDDGRWHPRKAASLIKVLALAPGHRLHREAIAAQGGGIVGAAETRSETEPGLRVSYG